MKFYKPVLKSLLGIAMILFGILLAIVGSVYIPVVVGLVGLVICIYALIGALPSDEKNDKQ